MEGSADYKGWDADRGLAPALSAVQWGLTPALAIAARPTSPTQPLSPGLAPGQGTALSSDWLSLTVKLNPCIKLEKMCGRVHCGQHRCISCPDLRALHSHIPSLASACLPPSQGCTEIKLVHQKLIWRQISSIQIPESYASGETTFLYLLGLWPWCRFQLWVPEMFCNDLSHSHSRGKKEWPLVAEASSKMSPLTSCDLHQHTCEMSPAAFWLENLNLNFILPCTTTDF